MARRCLHPAAAAVDIHEIGTPCGCSPRLLGVPSPIAAPCLLSPDATRDHAEGEQRHTDVNKLVGGGEILAVGTHLGHVAFQPVATVDVLENLVLIDEPAEFVVDDDLESEIGFLPNEQVHLVVGLGDQAVQESKLRIKSALSNSGIKLNQLSCVVNLSPANIKKIPIKKDSNIQNKKSEILSVLLAKLFQEDCRRI